jgi:hypothetical protein
MVFENRVQRRTSVTRRNEAIGGWRKLHKEELHNFYYLSSISRMVNSRRKRREGHIGY